MTRAHVSRSPYLTDMLDRWERIVDGNDIDAARAVAALEGETGNEMTAYAAPRRNRRTRTEE